MTHEPKKPGFGVIRDLFFTFSIFWAHLGTYVCPSVRAFFEDTELGYDNLRFGVLLRGTEGGSHFIVDSDLDKLIPQRPSELKPNDSASSFKSSINTSFSFVRILVELTACSSPQT